MGKRVLIPHGSVFKYQGMPAPLCGESGLAIPTLQREHGPESMVWTIFSALWETLPLGMAYLARSCSLHSGDGFVVVAGTLYH